MHDETTVHYVRVQRVSWMIGILAGLGIIAVTMFFGSAIDLDALQIALLALMVAGVITFAYKTEVKRQEAYLDREPATSRLTGYSSTTSRTHNERALMRGLKTALRAPGPADHLIRRRQW